jgi:predicted porin
VQAGYAFGNNMIKAAYGSQDRDDVDDDDLLDFDFDSDVNQWTIAFDHNFSKRTKVYALYNNVDDDLLPDWDAFSLGIVHKF